ncbi:MAG: isoprenylcysteine carboxylmethyltransferase family protein [Chloroflexi bacterium]|nr:isoprenylcysteine carboxylmethyltransferase family protein [Chloroflexota bacterium]
MRSKIVKRGIQVVVQFLILAALLFVSAGRLDWVWAWAYLGVGVGILIINVLVMPPELIAERGRTDRGGVKGWDRLISSLIAIPSLGLPIVAGLDERFGWSPQLALMLHLIGLAFIALGQGLFTWGMTANKFFSTAVRIQEERGHTVASEGPYRYVRHPGYVGYIIALFATALALGSLWALVPAVLATCLFVVRTALEDKTLQEELAGYKEYAQRVRYRLLPGVW